MRVECSGSITKGAVGGEVYFHGPGRVHRAFKGFQEGILYIAVIASTVWITNGKRPCDCFDVRYCRAA